MPDERFRNVIETRTVDARFYSHDVGSEPTLVNIDGVVYRCEDDQEHAVRFLEMEELRTKLQQSLNQQEWDLFFAYETMMENDATAELDAIEQKLIGLLPAHRAIILSVFEPDEYHVSGEEQVKHSHCVVPQSLPEDNKI